jgi:signal transduction histidine kinase
VDGLKDDEVMVQFEVHDTGPGFDAKDEEYMFKPFSQIDGSSTRAHGGSGLGLVISRQLVELHGGSLTARAEKGKGSCVYHDCCSLCILAKHDVGRLSEAPSSNYRPSRLH